MPSWFSKSPQGFSQEVLVAEQPVEVSTNGVQPEAAPDSSVVDEVPTDNTDDESAVDGELCLNEPSEALVPATESHSLMMLTQARFAIAQARSLDEIKSIRDKADAARKYAQAAGLGLEIQNYAAEIKLRAERRAGMLLKKLNLHGGDRREETADGRLTLEDIGVSKDQSSRWQLTATVPEKAFERYLEETREAEGEVTTAALVKMAREYSSKKGKKSEDESPAPASDGCSVVSTLTELVGARKFACVYADPPWPVGNEPSDEADSGLDNFRLAMLQQPISELVEEHCHLHLWATDESLFAAKAVIEGWGFEFKGIMVCLSKYGRPGNFWTESHEYLLLGVRGGLPFMERGMNSWMRANREPDGRSPANIRRLIERVSPGPYLELFGQKPVCGWTVYSTFMTGNADDAVAYSEGGEPNAEATSS